MSADNFLDFVTGELIDSFLAIVERLYWKPAAEWFNRFVTRIKLNIQRGKWFLSPVNIDDSDEVAEEEIAEMTEVINVMVDHVESLLGSLVGPLFIVILIFFRDETAMSVEYEIEPSALKPSVQT